MILEIPLQKVPNQTLTTTINNVIYGIQLNTRLGELYMSITKDNEPVIYNRICLNKTPIEEGFVFLDMSGNDNPIFGDLNDRFKLLWTDEV
jgi:hypothetical protein